jgi:hypothetical protein
MRVASQGARRPAAPKQNHPRRNKRKAGAAAALRSRPRGALDHAVRVVRGVCCLAGSASLIDDLRAELRAEGVSAAIRHHDTAILFDWLVAAVSYQGISDRVASGYMDRHGRARWRDIEAKLGHSASCPKLQSYWHYYGCRYDKISRTCAEPDHIDGCPLPSHDLRKVGSTRRPILSICSSATSPMAIWSAGSPGNCKTLTARMMATALPGCARP